MTEPARPAAPAGDGDEVDVVRAAIYFLGILLVGLVVVLGVLLHLRDGYREAVGEGEKRLPELARTYDQVRRLLKSYQEGKAEQARKETQTWMKERYGAAQIADGQVAIGPWRSRPTKDYDENAVQVTIDGVSREIAMHFVWNVERVSTKMRTLDLRLRRTTGVKDAEADSWKLVVTFGYRVPRGFKEGG